MSKLLCRTRRNLNQAKYDWSLVKRRSGKIGGLTFHRDFGNKAGKSGLDSTAKSKLEVDAIGVDFDAAFLLCLVEDGMKESQGSSSVLLRFGVL